MNNSSFNLSKYQLGKLCVRGHDWQNSGQSLRYISRNECVFCHRIRGNRPLVSRPSNEEIFWSKVKKTDTCWYWQGNCCPDGYGHFVRKSFKSVLAHRIAYELYYKCCILPGYNLCHTCDTPSCCNPHHLFVGTQAENNADKKRKGRACFGSKNYGTHLTEQDVFDIRSRYVKGSRTDGTVAIAKDYNMSKEAIAHIISRRTWKHI